MRPLDEEAVFPQPASVPPDLRDRWAVVTGAARGIGLAIAMQLHEAGAFVLAVDRDRRGLEEAFRGKSGIWWVHHDLAAADVRPDGKVLTSGHVLARKVLDRIAALRADSTADLPEHLNGVPTLLVNNAGVSSEHGFLTLDPDTYDHLYRVNVRTPLFLTQCLVRALLDEHAQQPTAPQRPAAVLFISSVHDRIVVHRPAYSTGKANLAQLTRELASDLGKYRIRVNAISPGWIRTDPDPTSPQQQAKWRRMTPKIPLRRAGQPEDVARVAAQLLSDYWSGYVTGMNVRVDGGLALATWMAPPDDGDCAGPAGQPLWQDDPVGRLEVSRRAGPEADGMAQAVVGCGEQEHDHAPAVDQQLGLHAHPPSAAQPARDSDTT